MAELSNALQLLQCTLDEFRDLISGLSDREGNHRARLDNHQKDINKINDVLSEHHDNAKKDRTELDLYEQRVERLEGKLDSLARNTDRNLFNLKDQLSTLNAAQALMDDQIVLLNKHVLGTDEEGKPLTGAPPAPPTVVDMLNAGVKSIREINGAEGDMFTGKDLHTLYAMFTPGVTEWDALLVTSRETWNLMAGTLNAKIRERIPTAPPPAAVVGPPYKFTGEELAGNYHTLFGEPGRTFDCLLNAQKEAWHGLAKSINRQRMEEMGI